jgi:rhodanese-related sulfurtransferase
MPKSYADLLREARDQIPEVTVQEVDAIPAGSATIVDVREASEWEQGHLPGAQHVSKSYIEQQIEAAAPDRDAPVVLYCAGGIRSLFAAQTLAEMGYSDVKSMKGGFQAWKGAGLDFETPVVLTAEQKQRYSRHLLIPEVGSAGQKKLLESKALLIGAVPPRYISPRPASGPSASSTSMSSTSATSSARSCTRPTASASARSNRHGSRSTPSTPMSTSSSTRRCWSPTTSRG